MLKIVNCSTGIDDIVFTAVETRLFHKAKKSEILIFFKSLKIYRFFKLPTFMLIQNTDILASGKKC